MGQQKIRLCEHLMTNYYGHDTGVGPLRFSLDPDVRSSDASDGRQKQQIASILLNRGQLPFANLVRLSGLPPKVVRAALMILIQQK